VPIGGGGDVRVARCEDGVIFGIRQAPYEPEQPGHGAGVRLGRCAGGCQSAAVVCAAAGCADAQAALCGAPSSTGRECPLAGEACTGASTTACPASTTCGDSLPGDTCTCTNGAYVCDRTTAAAQARLVGKWHGTVTPPSFAQPYAVSMWIYPDGTYWAEASGVGLPAFYYGGDGPWPSRKLTVLSDSATRGASADIGIWFGLPSTNTGAVSALIADASRLRFTFYASWFGCGQPFFFDLVRD
jgi:hypothetical protein